MKSHSVTIESYWDPSNTAGDFQYLHDWQCFVF
jgi:hypothetical protein